MYWIQIKVQSIICVVVKRFVEASKAICKPYLTSVYVLIFRLKILLYNVVLLL